MSKFAISAFYTIVLVTSSVALADTAADVKTIKVCQRLQKIAKPKGITQDKCYGQAKDYLQKNSIKIMTGSYQAYFALSSEDKMQATCASFLKAVVASTKEQELDEAKELFENDKAQSLDQAYYSYQQCMDREAALRKQGSTKSLSNAVR